jgi:integrase/recombinase XerD
MLPEYDEYLKILKNKSEKTQLVYKKYLELFFNMYPDINCAKDIEDMSAEKIRDFRDSISGAERTKNLARSVVSAFIYWMFNNEKIDSTKNIDRVERLKPPKKEKRSLTESERDALVANAKYLDVAAMMAMLSFQGLRRDEAINLKKSNYDGQSILVTGKGRRQRRMKLHPVTKNALDKYLASRKDDCEYLFICHRRDNNVWHPITGESIRIQVRESVLRANISHPEEIYPHALRRTFATLLFKRGVSLAKISKLMGHSGIGTTMLYINVDQEELDAAIDQQGTMLELD